ncbi:MAG: S41 family peptidase [Defluviitaleaceae bacterium]|nr:S41 family peptidase [Defluviitaleaceae bacterium]
MFKLILVLIFAASCGRGAPADTDAREESREMATIESPAETDIAVPEYPPESIPEPPPEAEPQPPGEPPMYTLAEVLEIANARREGLIKPGLERAEALVLGRTPQTIETWRFSAEVPRAEEISSADALYDAEILFEIMRQVYGAYTYFGGDEVFLPIFQEIRVRLAERDYWSVANFSTLLYNNLSPAIADNHFWIDGRQLGIRYDFFITDRSFERNENGFRCTETGRYVVSAEGHNINGLFRLAMNDAGEFYYTIVVAVPRTITYYLTLVYKCGYYEELRLNRLPPATSGGSGAVTLRQIGDIPFVAIGSMGFPDSTYGFNNASARQFLEIAYELLDEPVIVVDIRGNSGGNGTLHSRFLHILTGEVVPQNYLGLRTGSYQGWPDIPYESVFFFLPEIVAIYAPSEPFGDYHTLRDTATDRVVENDRLIILLTDRNSASASDGFADALLNVENTLIIGHNTAGVLHTDMTYPSLFLPRSGMSFGLGRAIHLHPEGHLQEGVGVAPDIWFTGRNLMTAIVNLLET